MSVVFDVEMQVLDSEIPVEFAQEIRLDPPSFVPKTFTANGTYSASSDGADGYNPVTVDVQPPLEEKTVTENGEVTPTWAYGLSKVTVKVDTQSAYDEGYAAGESAGVENGIEQGKQEILDITNAGLADFSPVNFVPATEETLIDTILECASAQWNDGFEKGKKAEYDRFWDVYQENGQRKRYFYAFAGGGWTPESFNPKYPIRIVETATPNRHCEGMFYGFMRGYEGQPISLTPEMVDFSQAMLIQDTFSNAYFDTITADFSNAVSLYGAFQQHKAVNQDKTTRAIYLKVTEKCTNFKSAFNQCSNLEELQFTADSIIAAQIDIADCKKLSHESLMSILYALKDGANLTCTLGKLNLAKLTDGEKAIATEKGWTLA